MLFLVGPLELHRHRDNEQSNFVLDHRRFESDLSDLLVCLIESLSESRSGSESDTQATQVQVG
jgi:hypothetical protein